MSKLKKIKEGDTLLRFGSNGSQWNSDTPEFYSVLDDKVCFISASDGMCRASTQDEWERMNLRDKPSFDEIKVKNPIIVTGSYNMLKGTTYEKNGQLHLFVDTSSDIVFLKS